jgi:hypothetical protein
MGQISLLQTVETSELATIEGGAALDLTSVFSKVKVQVTETHKAFAKVDHNTLGDNASINLVQTVS